MILLMIILVGCTFSHIKWKEGRCFELEDWEQYEFFKFPISDYYEIEGQRVSWCNNYDCTSLLLELDDCIMYNPHTYKIMNNCENKTIKICEKKLITQN